MSGLSDEECELLRSFATPLMSDVRKIANVIASRAWTEGHAAGRDYQADGWNSDAHDPEEDNPYRTAD